MLSTQTEEQIREVLNRYVSLYEKRDIEAILQLFAPDIMCFGKARDDIILNKAACEQQFRWDFERVGTLSLQMSNCTIKAEGTISWVMGDLTIAVDTLVFPCRFTMVLRGTGHRWEIVQMHFSLADRE